MKLIDNNDMTEIGVKLMCKIFKDLKALPRERDEEYADGIATLQQIKQGWIDHEYYEAVMTLKEIEDKAGISIPIKEKA